MNLVRRSLGITQYLISPLPNTLYTRDTTCWVYGGCTVNPLFWPARRDETLLATAIYRFHPDFAGKVKVWWGDPDADHGLATVEGGDVMPAGNRTMLIGLSERTSRQGIGQLARALFAQDAVDHVLVAAMPSLRAAMHLDTVFTSFRGKPRLRVARRRLRLRSEHLHQHACSASRGSRSSPSRDLSSAGVAAAGIA